MRSVRCWRAFSTVPKNEVSLRRWSIQRPLHTTPSFQVIKPYLLADIGEGIREVQIIQWFVKPGARVEQFQALCEVQSDKATVEITSRFDGVVKKLHYDADDMAQVGKPLVDIDIQSEISAEDEALTTPPEEKVRGVPAAVPTDQKTSGEGAIADGQPAKPDAGEAQILEARIDMLSQPSSKEPSGRYQTLATPAVRRLTKEMNVNIGDVRGTGKDGRVLKEDVVNHAKAPKQSGGSTTQTATPMGEDKTVPLTQVQSQMLKSMTKSLQIPHFLYSDSVDFTAMTQLRRSINNRATADGTSTRISALAFILKATSLALAQYPLLNARLDTSSDKPQLHYRASHNISIAVDAPQGLLVPVVKNVQALSIVEIAAEISRLSALGREGKFSASDLIGGTVTVSNVGSIGGGVVSPVIVEGQSAIVGIGRAKKVPAFDENGAIIAKEECVFSWSADHRFIDGATAARCAELVKKYIEAPGEMAMQLR